MLLFLLFGTIILFKYLGITSSERLSTISGKPSEGSLLAATSIEYDENKNLYLIYLRASKGGDDFYFVVTPEQAKSLGLKKVPPGKIYIRIFVEDLRYDYPLIRDRYTSGEPVILYKVWGSTASEGCLVNRLPYDKVSLETTRAYANGEIPNDAIVTTMPPIFPRGIEQHLPVDYWDKAIEIGEWAYWMPEGHTYGGRGECTNENQKGDWYVTNLAGTPYAEGYKISTSANIKFKIRVVLETENGTVLSTYITDNKLVNVLSDENLGKVEWQGGVIGLKTPPIPAVDWSVIKYIKEIPPVKTKYGADIKPGGFKFVPRYVYDDYKSQMQSLVDFDPDYFVFTEEIKPISVMLVRNPMGGVVPNQEVLITARVVEPSTKTPVPFAVVHFSVSGGSLSSSSCITGISGECSVKFRPNSDGIFNIQANAFAFGMSSNAIMGINVNTPELAISANPSRFVRGGSSTVTVELPKDIAKSVRFSTTGGRLSREFADFGVDGIAQVRFSSDRSGVYTVTATAEDKYGNQYVKQVSIRVTDPPPQRRRDPSVGADFMITAWNNFNNFLAGMLESKGVPEGCALRGGVVTCEAKDKSIYFPDLLITLNADRIGFVELVGKPQIMSIDVPPLTYEGSTGVITIEFQNIGDSDDYFDVSLKCPNNNVAATTQRVFGAKGKTTTVSITYTGSIESVYDCKVSVMSVNSPTFVTEEEVELNIVRHPLAEKLEGLEGVPQRLDEQGKQIQELNKTVQQFVALFMRLITVLFWVVVIAGAGVLLFVFYRITRWVSKEVGKGGRKK